jgi:hypothetical protein
MKTRTIILIGMLAALAASCIPSLFPLYTEDDIVWDERIEGSWKMDNGSIWIIERLEHHPDASFMDPKWTEPDEDSEPGNIHYRLTVKEICKVDPGGTGIKENDTVESDFDLHLLELEGRMYVNFYPTDWELHHGFLHWHMVEVNTFARINLAEESMTVQYFDPDFLVELIENNRVRIEHVMMDNYLLLTAPTEDLQKFVMKYGDENDALLSEDYFQRI